MNPPKPKATEEDALALLWAFLIDKTTYPPSFDKKSLTRRLRDAGMVVPKVLSEQLRDMCNIRKRSEQYRISWLQFMGIENPKTIHQEFKEFYDKVKNRAKKKSHK